MDQNGRNAEVDRKLPKSWMTFFYTCSLVRLVVWTEIVRPFRPKQALIVNYDLSDYCPSLYFCEWILLVSTESLVLLWFVIANIFTIQISSRCHISCTGNWGLNLVLMQSLQMEGWVLQWPFSSFGLVIFIYYLHLAGWFCFWEVDFVWVCLYSKWKMQGVSLLLAINLPLQIPIFA